MEGDAGFLDTARVTFLDAADSQDFRSTTIYAPFSVPVARTDARLWQ